MHFLDVRKQKRSLQNCKGITLTLCALILGIYSIVYTLFTIVNNQIITESNHRKIVESNNPKIKPVTFWDRRIVKSNHPKIKPVTDWDHLSEKESFKNIQLQKLSDAEHIFAVLDSKTIRSEVKRLDSPQSLLFGYYKGLYDSIPGTGRKEIHFVNPPGYRALSPEDYVSLGIRLRNDDKVLLSSQLAGLMKSIQSFQGTLGCRDSGVVINGGGEMLEPSITVIWTLRKSGSLLPVELWMFEKENPAEDTHRLLHELGNVRVRFYESYSSTISEFTEMNNFFNMRIYTHKIASIVFSSFCKVLMLDADQIVLRDPSLLFESFDFRQYGSILWPDFWGVTYDPDILQIIERARNDSGAPKGFRSVNSRHHTKIIPEFYLQDIDYKAVNNDLSFAAPRETHETGQILVDKERHFQALCLAFYLLLYPTNIFSVMLGGGIVDNGEKEIVPWALTIMGGDYALMEQPRSMSDGEGRQMRDYLQVVGFPKAIAHMAPDSLPIFIHACNTKWKCCQVMGTLHPEKYRFSYMFGNRPLLDTFPGVPSASIFNSRTFIDAGGADWLVNNDPEKLVWEFTRSLCKLTGKYETLMNHIQEALAENDAMIFDNQVLCRAKSESLH